MCLDKFKIEQMDKEIELFLRVINFMGKSKFQKLVFLLIVLTSQMDVEIEPKKNSLNQKKLSNAIVDKLSNRKVLIYSEHFNP